MVFFTCNACGESLKKVQVDKHVSMCRGCQVLSCIDCGKDFWGDDYKNHIRCISEDQKYGGKGYEAKVNKGDVKQQQWLQRIHDAMNKPGVSARLKEVLNHVSAYDNVPRKKAKFENWMRNSLRINNSGLHEEVWLILNATADGRPDAPQKTNEEQQMVAEVDANGIDHQNGRSDVKKKKLNKQERREACQQREGGAAREPQEDQTAKKKKDKKRKIICEEDGEETSCSKRKKKSDSDVAHTDESEQTEETAAPKGKFNWKGNIKAVLRESPDQELPEKKLRKKVLAAYLSFTGDANFKTTEQLLALFNRKISKNPSFRVLKDKVKLIK